MGEGAMRKRVKKKDFPGTASGTIKTFLLGEELEIDVDVGFNVTSFGYPAKTYGPPEDCYPAEGPEFDLDDTFTAQLPGGVLLTCSVSECSDQVIRQLEEIVFQSMADSDDPRESIDE
jgi:hypothetical protein